MIKIHVYVYICLPVTLELLHPPLNMTELSAFLSTSPATMLRCNSSNRLPRRVSTEPTPDLNDEGTRFPAKKRIIVCCDGWVPYRRSVLKIVTVPFHPI